MVSQNISIENTRQWYRTAPVTAFPADGGGCVKIGERQIAVFHFKATGEWYACQNMCPHKAQMILARGLIGDCQGEPKVACPFHKKTFSLKTGQNLNGEEYAIETYPVRVEDGFVYIAL
ncbi:nitrite reductase small subunit NirD [Larkinella soli]|uniref:nitrite reductase small subunit NirD n=1 Tax=Larkinella soli TaxID=1770527 RepID=UPI000FFB6D64|nr:nitrite reductase small subunit NirD [Larkinella soli]